MKRRDAGELQPTLAGSIVSGTISKNARVGGAISASALVVGGAIEESGLIVATAMCPVVKDRASAEEAGRAIQAAYAEALAKRSSPDQHA